MLIDMNLPPKLQTGRTTEKRRGTGVGGSAARFLHTTEAEPTKKPSQIGI